MGLFTDTEIYVSSVVYNLAGPEKDRPNFLKTTVISNVVGNMGYSMSDTIESSYLNGPGIKLDAFERWSQREGYGSLLGITNAALRSQREIDPFLVRDQLPVGTGPSGEELRNIIQFARIGPPDFTEWGEQYVLDNPSIFASTKPQDYMYDWVQSTGEVVIYPQGGGPVVARFVPYGFYTWAQYIYADYVESAKPSREIITDTGCTYAQWTASGGNPAFPPRNPQMTLADQKNENFSPTATDTTKIEISYSDGRPSEEYSESTPITLPYTQITRYYQHIQYLGIDASNQSHADVAERTELSGKFVYAETTVDTVDDVISGGVTRTTKTTKVLHRLENRIGWRDTTEKWLVNSWSHLKKFIYQRGTGNPALDALFDSTIEIGAVFPFIPFRINNKMVPEIPGSLPPNTEEMSRKALKKAIRAKYDDLLKNIEDNPSLGDIDYAYAVFGVSLNVAEHASKEYIYRFFQELRVATPGGDLSTFDDWVQRFRDAHASAMVWDQWYQQQRDPNDPLYGTQEPGRVPYPVPPEYTVHVTTAGAPVMNYDMKVSWSGMDEFTGTGEGWPGAKTGQLKLLVEPPAVLPYLVQNYDETVLMEETIPKMSIIWQYSPNQWRKMTIWNLRHLNTIYKGKGVQITSTEAIQDTEESGFILPLHRDLYRGMSLVRRTQMSTANTFLVFNCYKEVKTKWYQSGLFKVFLVIVVIAVSFYYPPTSGLLGTNLAVGTALGFTGLAATIVGAVANALAAMILTQIVTRASTALFGDKLGMIIGTIASIMAVQVGTNMIAGKGMVLNMSQLFRADNLLKLTASGVNGVSNYISASTAEMIRETQSLVDSYSSTLEKIQAAWDANIGTGPDNTLDPLMFTQAGMASFEAPDGYLNRTLLVGSEVAEMSLAMISKFTELTLALETS